MQKYINLEACLVDFLQKEVKKAGFSKILLGLSGGLDSAIVAVLSQKAFMKDFKVLIMPSLNSNEKNLLDAKNLCEKFGIDYSVKSIKELEKVYFKDKSPTLLQKGNFCARMRMATLYDESFQTKALVVGTSNKSELLLGYGTIYGDLACALNPLGELYKSDLFGFAKFLEVPKNILNKPPSADLWEGQEDEKDLGFSYENIDAFLRDFVDMQLNDEELEKKHDKTLIQMVKKRFYQNQFKRRLPTIAKLNNKIF